MTMFYFIRHGEAAWRLADELGLVGAQRDFVALTPDGMGQSELASRDPRLRDAQLSAPQVPWLPLRHCGLPWDGDPESDGNRRDPTSGHRRMRLGIEDCLSIAKDLPGYFTESAIGAMSRDLVDEEFFIARNARETTGFVCVKQKSPHVFEILWMAVRNSLTGHGIGTTIMDNLCCNLKSMCRWKGWPEDVLESPLPAYQPGKPQ